jgi:hypothetical protein
MTLRVTQQVVEVLIVNPDGAGGTDINADAENTVSLTQTATSSIIAVSAENTIVLAQVAQVREFDVTASSTIVLAQVASGELFGLVDATNSLTLTQLAIASGPITVTATSTLELTHESDFAENIEAGAFNTITLSHEAVHFGPKTVTATSVLNLGSEADTTDKFRSLVSTIEFSQEAVFTISKLAKTIITLIQEADKDLRSTATSQLLTLDHVAEALFGEESIIELTHEATVIRPSVGNDYFLQHSLTLVSTASLTQVRTDTASSTIGLKQTLGYVLVSDTTLCDYSPFIGSTSDPNAPTPPAATLPAADTGMASGVKFEYPTTSPTSTITLESSMNLGDINRLAFDKIIRESRGGTLFVFADPNWPKSESLLFTISNIKPSDATLMKNFIELTAGREIRLTTHEGRIWDGYITNPSEVVVQDRRDSFTVTVEFEGTEV